MEDHIDRVLIDRRTIAERVRELAAQIADELGGKADADPRSGSRAGREPPQITLIAVLTGSLIFLADLIRHMPLMMRIRLITVRSYPGPTTSSRGPRLEGHLPDDLAGQHVVIVDDVLDSGRTITLVRRMVEQRRPASLRLCALLRKRVPSAMAVPAEYIGFDIPDAFVVGYGLDFDGFYRNLPEVVTLKPHVLDRERIG